jgi:hypothetical protein
LEREGKKKRIGGDEICFSYKNEVKKREERKKRILTPRNKKWKKEEIR